MKAHDQKYGPRGWEKPNSDTSCEERAVGIGERNALLCRLLCTLSACTGVQEYRRAEEENRDCAAGMSRHRAGAGEICSVLTCRELLGAAGQGVGSYLAAVVISSRRFGAVFGTV